VITPDSPVAGLSGGGAVVVHLGSSLERSSAHGSCTTEPRHIFRDW
jgi:hypothetical protein